MYISIWIGILARWNVTIDFWVVISSRLGILKTFFYCKFFNTPDYQSKDQTPCWSIKQKRAPTRFAVFAVGVCSEFIMLRNHFGVAAAVLCKCVSIYMHPNNPPSFLHPFRSEICIFMTPVRAHFHFVFLRPITWRVRFSYIRVMSLQKFADPARAVPRSPNQFNYYDPPSFRVTSHTFPNKKMAILVWRVVYSITFVWIAAAVTGNRASERAMWTWHGLILDRRYRRNRRSFTAEDNIIHTRRRLLLASSLSSFLQSNRRTKQLDPSCNRPGSLKCYCVTIKLKLLPKFAKFVKVTTFEMRA